ncbi:hypothetical protein COO60DRAFT_1170686 [Scenedesmus sp. NREL 46B-D3]|nr:hypothetical protein COO60DRAFT_1170686 [Scenedesmus sp. NREL 46B-D3]
MSMESPTTPEGGHQRTQSALTLRPINNLTEQLQGCTISKPKKREQTTATPASQARPRTQRRTGQENEMAGAGGSAADDSCSVTPSRLNCISELQDELSCGICLEICVRPCATPCGHAFCRACLRLALQHKRQCPNAGGGGAE